MKQLKSINPHSGELISLVDELSDEKIGELVSRSFDSFLSYKQISFTQRKKWMLSAAELLRKNSRHFAGLITSEMGKLIGEAEAEVQKCAWVCEYYAEHAESMLSGREVKSDASESRVMVQPIGPVLAVMPWNFPFWQVFRFAAPTLMAGNTALLKHASNVQGCAQAIEALFTEAGFPEGVFLNLSVGASKVNGIISSPLVKAVTLTGSEAAGRAVAEAAGRNLKKCVLELGGNNAFVVLNDADLDRAVEVALAARLQNCGQSCIAAKRFILEEKIHDQFLGMLIENLKELKSGDPMDPGVRISPLFSVTQAYEIDDQVKKSIQKGAVLLFGGEKNQAFYAPAILTEVLPGMPVFDEETFGPVFAISRARDPRHALELSNTSDFGLGMQVFTSSEDSARMFIDAAEEGAVFVNGLVKSDPRLPFGGVKNSGFGRELSSEGILEFVNIKTIWKA